MGMNIGYLTAGRGPESDECMTPFYACEPLLKYIPKDWTVWCPCDEEWSAYYNIFKENGYNVIRSSLKEGKDFFEYEPSEHYDCIITNPPFSCYSSDTEIKTKDGWKKYTELTSNDEVLSCNIKTQQLEWSKINMVIEKDVDEDLCHFKHRGIDILVTKDHRMYTRDCVKSNPTDVDVLAKDINKRHYLPGVGYKWAPSIFGKTSFVLPGCFVSNGRKDIWHEDIEISWDCWLPFFGLWLADGCVIHTKNTKNKQRYTVLIKQNNENAEKIRNILSKLPFNYHEYIETEKTNFAIHNKQLWLYLNQFGYSKDKYIPRQIMDLPQDKLRLLLDAYLLGDSHTYYYRNLKKITISTISSKLADNLQEIILKLGMLVNVKQKKGKYKGEPYFHYEIYYGEKDFTRIHYINYKKTKEYQHYKGKVFCLNIEKNSYFVLRRNGKIFISGNCKDQILKRLDELGKPFAILLPLNSLQGQTRYEVFKKGIQLLAFDKRIGFHTNNNMQTTAEGNHFASAYFCRGILPRDLILEELVKYERPLINKE